MSKRKRGMSLLFGALVDSRPLSVHAVVGLTVALSVVAHVLCGRK